MPLSLDGTTGISATGNIVGNNINANTLSVTTFAPASVSAVGNVTGGNVLTAGIMSSTGNGIHGNVLTGGLISATSTITSAANVVGGNLLTGGQISATGAITTAANISLTGNIIDSGELWINTLANGNLNLNPNGTGQTNIPTGILSVTGNIQGGNLRTVGLVSATGSITTAADISITGNIVDGAALTIITSSNGNITLAPNGTGVVVVNTDIRNGQASGTGNIGASGATFNTIFARATSAQYADLAEMYLADGPLHPGTVVEFGGSNEITITVMNHSSCVAGIISTRPSHLMNATLTGEHAYPVALTGRVPCTVIGKISKGDCLVSSDHPGAAQRLDSEKFVPGCIVGKALQDHDSDSIGTIEVAVGRF